MRSALKLVLALTVFAAMPQVAAEDGSGEMPKTIGSIERIDPAFDELVSKDAEIEVLADGYEWAEGPVWVAKGNYLLFSDIPRNQIVKWKDGEGASVFMEPSGYTGAEPFAGHESGTNGLTFDGQGRLVMCCHGDRQIARIEEDGSRTVLASHADGKRFNSPNDLIYHSNGDLYFTDPPYGLPEGFDDPTRELDWCGVYRLGKDGPVTLLTKDMTRPNGIGFSPDEKTLYVAQSDGQAAIWKAFPMRDDGSLGEGRVFYDATKWVDDRPGAPDGLAVDSRGNLWATGPGGVLVFSPDGNLLGRLSTGEATANCAFGEDGKTLFITADMYLCKIRTLVKGLGF